MNIDNLKIDSTLKIMALVGAVGSFLWGVYQYSDATRARAEARRLEASKPFLEKQLTLYSETTQIAANIATTIAAGQDVSALKSDIDRFWQLYWGELALVEDIGVESAMKKFGSELQTMDQNNKLSRLSLELAHACRMSLAKSWGVELWESHYSETTGQDTGR